MREMMGLALLALAGGAALWGSPAAAQSHTAPPASGPVYTHETMFHIGYDDKRIGQGRWRIAGSSDGWRPADAVNLMLYRGALFARSQGYAFLKVVKGRVTRNAVLTKADFTMVGMAHADDPVPCETDGFYAGNCQIESVDEIIATAGPLLFRGPDQISADLDEVGRVPVRR